jgi:hypothetical protein
MSRMSGWLVLVALAVLASCGHGETDLPFESVAQAERFWTSHPYSDTNPDLLVITSPEEVDAPGTDIEFDADLAEQLRAVDYRTRFVVIVLRGELGGTSPSFAIDVLEVTRSGDRVVVQTHFGELGPEQGSLMAFSSPYHAISIAKEGQWAQKIRFELKEDGRTVKERTHFVP